MQNYNVTVLAKIRKVVVVPASSKEEAEQQILLKIQQEGLEYAEELMFGEMYDSIAVERVD